MWSIGILSAALLFNLCLGSVIPVAEVCEGQDTLAETYIGKDTNVLVQFATCPHFGAKVKTLKTRQLNVCGNQCITSCFTPSGGGPNTNDCHIIADALRFNSQNGPPLFTIGTGTNNTVALTYASCLTFFVNQDAGQLEYCNTEWANLIDFIAPNCAAAQNAHGGICVATNQQWFVQLNHA
ncbi:hypothetical protein DFH06DRAFT_316555 [Mycena polygramma]|nr:hypothetical protein DFH06DRAFT_316555 [Mycena polygramma]